MQSWIKIDQNSDFSIYNIPFGIFSSTRKIRLEIRTHTQTLRIIAHVEVDMGLISIDVLGIHKS